MYIITSDSTVYIEYYELLATEWLQRRAPAVGRVDCRLLLLEEWIAGQCREVRKVDARVSLHPAPAGWQSGQTP